jgi:CheY-like chemotaxis protein
MVVDDDTLVLHSTAAMLEDLGHRALQATSGEQALSVLGQHPEVELLITDHASLRHRRRGSRRRGD